LDGTCLVNPVVVSAFFEGVGCGTADRNSFHNNPSLASTHEGFAYLTWISNASCFAFLPATYPSQLTYGPFDMLDDVENWPSPTAPPAPIDARREYATSSGIGMVDTTPAASSSWTRVDPVEEVFGLLYESNESGVGSIRGCYDYWTCQERATQRQPCVSALEDGTLCVIWSDAEDEEDLQPAFNIRMQLFDVTGEPIGDEVVVNHPELEPELVTQTSPSISFSDDGYITCVWTGPRPLDDPFADPPTICSGNYQRIFARVFYWDGGEDEPVAVCDQFMVDADPTIHADSPALTRPSVALSSANDGRFFIAWGTAHDISGLRNVHGQYFEIRDDPAVPVAPLGEKFQVNQSSATLDSCNQIRRLGLMQQCWGPGCEATGLEQFQAAQQKLAELGLP
jgi:hypothetical protein